MLKFILHKMLQIFILIIISYYKNEITRPDSDTLLAAIE